MYGFLDFYSLLYINDFSEALVQGYRSSKESLLNPEEGTIITVMKDVANKSIELKNVENIHIESFLDQCYHHSVKSLEETMLQWGGLQ